MAPGARDVSKVFRKPVRVSITISHAVFSDLVRLSMDQGRSVSNLAAYLLEAALGHPGF